MFLWGIEKLWFRVGWLSCLGISLLTFLWDYVVLLEGFYVFSSSLCVALGVFMRLWNFEFRALFLCGYYRSAICFTIRFVHFTCVFWCDSCEMRKRNVVQRVAWPMNRWSEIWMFRAVEFVKRGVLFMFLSPFGMFLCIFVCLSFYLFNELYIWITK